MSYQIKPLVFSTERSMTMWHGVQPFEPDNFILWQGHLYKYNSRGKGKKTTLAENVTFEQADAIVQAHYRNIVTDWLNDNLLQPPRPNPPIATWD